MDFIDFFFKNLANLRFFLKFNYSAAFSSLCKKAKSKAATTAPNNGPTIKIQTCVKAVASPVKIKFPKAVARLLAGLTDVPVRGIPTK